MLMKSTAWSSLTRLERAPARVRRPARERSPALDTALEALAVAVTVALLLIGLDVWTARVGPTMFQSWGSGGGTSIESLDREPSHVP